MKLVRWFPLIIFAGIGFFLWRGLNNDPHSIPSPLVNKRMPTFVLPSLLQSEHPLSERLFQGHVSVLNVFSSWCGYCAIEQPIIAKIANHSIKVYGLNYKDQRNPALEWLKRFGNPFAEIIFDPKGKLALDLGVYGTPETFIVDAYGIIRYKYVGPLTQQQWDEFAQNLKKLARRI